MKTFVRTALTVCSVSFLAGCGSNDSDGTPKPPSSPSPSGLLEGTASLPNGTWNVACENDPEDNDRSSQMNMVIQEKTMKLGVTSYASPNCNSKQKQVTYFLNFEFKVGPTSTKIANAKKVDLKRKNRSIAPQSSALTSFMNREKFCGIEDWTSGVERVVSANMPNCIDETENSNETLSGWLLFEGNIMKLYDDETETKPTYIATKE